MRIRLRTTILAGWRWSTQTISINWRHGMHVLLTSWWQLKLSLSRFLYPWKNLPLLQKQKKRNRVRAACRRLDVEWISYDTSAVVLAKGLSNELSPWLRFWGRLQYINITCSYAPRNPFIVTRAMCWTRRCDVIV